MTRLFLLVIGPVEEFAFDEIKMYFLIFILLLFLNCGVARQAFESLSFESFKGGLPFFLVVRVEGEFSKLRLWRVMNFLDCFYSGERGRHRCY